MPKSRINFTYNFNSLLQRTQLEIIRYHGDEYQLIHLFNYLSISTQISREFFGFFNVDLGHSITVTLLKN
jgi:hypothetical protein